jgi:phage terminase small subunit
MRNEFLLNDRQRHFVDAVAAGQSATEAAKAAGYSAASAHVRGCRLMKVKAVQDALAEKRAEIAEELELTREKVMRGLLEAVEIARLQADPAALVKAWSELARLCGFYAPERKQVEVSVSAKRMVDQFEAMSDKELLQILEQPALPETTEGDLAFLSGNPAR